MDANTVAALVGRLVMAGGGGAAIAFLIMRSLGEKWISSKFEERFANYLHTLEKDLEQLRFEISKLMDRTMKLHQREFEVLPETWGRLSDAKNRVSAFISPFQSYPDLDRMNPQQLGEFVKETDLDEWQKVELLELTKKRTAYYADAVFYTKYSKCRTLCREFSIYLLKNGIFIPKDIKDRFKILEEIVWNALEEREINKRIGDSAPDHTRNISRARLENEGRDLITSLENDIQSRLWTSELH